MTAFEGEPGMLGRRCRQRSLSALACWLAAGALVAVEAQTVRGPAGRADRADLAESAAAASPAHPAAPACALPPPPPAKPPACPDDVPTPQLALSPTEVTKVIEAAAAALDSPPMTVAVVDRIGNVLGLYHTPGATAANDDLDDLAVGLARTGAFFSNDAAPLSSRTVRFISGIHFPPVIANTSNGALYGIEQTNRGCSLDVTFLPGQCVPPAGSRAGGPCKGATKTGCGTGPVTGKLDPVTGKLDLFESDQGAVNPGGVPLFRGPGLASLVGGIGVAGVPPEQAEFAAFQALKAFNPKFAPPPPGVVFINGVRLPFVVQAQQPAGTHPGTATGTFTVSGLNGACAPVGDLIQETGGSQISKSEVNQIVNQAMAGANLTRAQIRLPIGSRARMVIAVSDLDGTLLALYRMRDATVFSIDVAVAKARNVVYFSSGSAGAQADLPAVPPGTAVTNRTIGFGAQPLYPPGINGSGLGPFFDLLQRDAANPCTQGFQAANPHQNGIVFFPGSVPLYRGSQLIGGLGVSGDGVDQDDFVTFLGAQGFLPPPDLWADQVFVDGVRLPFLKFPRNPEG
jgi:uncharacterized protein GlcG (DUF336 family)